MTQAMRIMATLMPVVAVATLGYSRTGTMTSDQMGMMDDHMKGGMKGKM